jgi:hypothetical protein
VLIVFSNLSFQLIAYGSLMSHQHFLVPFKVMLDNNPNDIAMYVNFNDIADVVLCYCSIKKEDCQPKWFTVC